MDASQALEHDLRGSLNCWERFAECLRAYASGALLLIIPLCSIADLNVVIIEGLGGEARYAEQFDEQVVAIRNASQTLTENDKIRLFRASDSSRDAILEHFDSLATAIVASDQVAVFMIGHGSYDDYQYKFNISGPDLTGEDIAQVLDALPSDNQLLVNTSSASGVLLESLEKDQRMLIFATRNGVERHATRFGSYFSAALNEATADVDKNSVVSAAEAFRFAERQVADYFERNGQLVTEHSRMQGDRADRFALSRLGAKPRTSNDSELERLTDRRDALNVLVDELRLSRDEIEPDEYQERLLQNMLELAELEESIEAREKELGLGN